MSTNKPSIGSVVLEIFLDTWGKYSQVLEFFLLTPIRPAGKILTKLNWLSEINPLGGAV
jgi:hypothetical protein